MELRDYLLRIRSDAEAALQALSHPIETEVAAGDNLQSALDRGGVIRLAEGVTFNGNFLVRKSDTSLLGRAGSVLSGASHGPAISVQPGVENIVLSDFTARTLWDQSCVQVGLNDPVQQPMDAPRRIMLSHLHVPKHRGKRAFELNCAELTMDDCGCADVYDPAGRDSQGIWIGNAPGDIHVLGGTYEAASEIILVGGGGGTQASKIVPSGLRFENLTLSRPLSWQTDGVRRTVKTSFELKTGHSVTLKACRIVGCWKDGQDGYAMTITPRDGGSITDVRIEDVALESCGSGLNLLGHDNERYSPQVQRVYLSRVRCLPEKRYGAGRFIQMGGEPLDIRLEDCYFDGPDSIVLSYAAKVWDSPSASRMGYVAKGTKLLRNTFISGAYGLMLTGAQGAGAFGRFWKEAWPDGVISGNRFGGASGLAHKPHLPSDNEFSA